MTRKHEWGQKEKGSKGKERNWDVGKGSHA